MVDSLLFLVKPLLLVLFLLSVINSVSTRESEVRTGVVYFFYIYNYWRLSTLLLMRVYLHCIYLNTCICLLSEFDINYIILNVYYFAALCC